MVYKKRFILLLMLILIMPVFAQEINESEELAIEEDNEEQELNYYLDRSGREPRFIQRLTWRGDEYAFRYVLIIERRTEDERYIEVERLSTETSSAEVSLIAGHYRYAIEVYDLFDDLSFTTMWHNFEVIRAIQPSLSSFSPGIFYLDEDEEWVVTVRGTNFLPQTAFMLVQDNSRIRPQNVILDGNTARLEFSGASLYPGEFNVYALNPGGLDHSLPDFRILNKKPFDINISLGYMPIIPLYGFLFEDFVFENFNLDAPFDDPFYPLSAGFRISFLPLKRTWGNIGVDLSGSFSVLYGDRTNYSTYTYLLNGHVSFLYQMHFFKRRFFINLSVGGGIFALMDFYYDFGGTTLDPMDGIYFSAAGGVSFTYIFIKPWFITLGADFIQFITPPPTDDPMPALIRPYILFGIQL